MANFLKLTENELGNVIGHAANIMADKAPTKFTLHTFEGFQAAVEITSVLPPGDDYPRELYCQDLEAYGPPGHCAWDQVKVNGKHCGNRHGGKQEYTKLVTEFLKARG